MGRKQESKGGGAKENGKERVQVAFAWPLAQRRYDARQLQLCCAGAGGGVFLSGPVAAIITTQSRDQTQITVITRRLGGLGLRQNWGGSAKMAPRHACSGTALRETQHARYMPDLLGPFIPWLMAYR